MPSAWEHLAEFEKLLRHTPFGLITDIDGTISETAPSPQEARVSPICREKLRLLTKRLALVAVVTGRPVGEARRMVGVEELVYVGNHGLEVWAGGEVKVSPAARGYQEKIAALLKELAGLLALEGLILEDKGVTATIHYRRCPDRGAARAAALAALERSGLAKGLRVSEGKMAVELAPPVGASKGTALLSLAKEYQLKGAIYLGDDVSDVEAFVALHRGLPGLRGAAIAPINEETPPAVTAEADFTLDGVAGVERFLTWLVGVTPVLAS